MINITGKNKAKILAALYNNSMPLGLGLLRFDPASMTESEAEVVLSEMWHIDYLKGRVIKTDFSSDELDPWGYDRDNGDGAMAQVIAELE